jgi:hypothetical protein
MNNKFLQGFVQVVGVGLMVSCVVHLHGLPADEGLEGFIGIGQRREVEGLEGRVPCGYAAKEKEHS